MAQKCVFAFLALWAQFVAAQEFHVLRGHGGPVMGLAEQNGRIASASFDNRVLLWIDGVPHERAEHDAAANTVAFRADGVLVSGGDDFVLRQGTSERSGIIWTHKGKVMNVAISSTGQIASASWDGTIGLSKTEGHRFLTGHSNAVNDVAFSSDGKRLWSVSADGTLREWDAETGEQRRLVLNHGFGINRIVVAGDDSWIAYGAVDGSTRIIDTITGKKIADFTLDRRPILAMALSSDGRSLAVGDGEGYIIIVDTVDLKITHDFRATERGPVWALVFSGNGQNIYAGGLDEKIYSWPIDALDEYEPMKVARQDFLQAPETMSNGERQFKRKCSICHNLRDDSKRRAGPHLGGLFGRKAGTVSNYHYSEAVAGSGIIWDDTTIDALFDVGPDKYIAGTKMPVQRIARPKDRADLISYLKQATGKVQ
jgi:cytochrome c